MTGRYITEQPFALGAQARIYRAIDRITGARCLLKKGASVREEAFLARQLNHPFIVKPYDLGADESFGSFAAYPEIAGETLLQWHQSRSDGDLKRIVLQIAEFLSFLHHRGWLYNDFKPEHFLVQEEELKVLDLGLCTPFKNPGEQPILSTYSGTFPCISPERLLGRPCDERSDIFALGMMLLQIHFPQQSWSQEPSLAALQELQQAAAKWRGFWGAIIAEMTALEPTQRIASGEELWRRLLPDSAQKSFLFFPIPANFTITADLLESAKVLVFESQSRSILEGAENQTMLLGWRLGYRVFTFDLARNDVEKCFRLLSEVLFSRKSIDFYSASDLLANEKLEDPALVLFTSTVPLQPRQKSLLSFGLSRLNSSASVRAVLATVHPFTELGENAKCVRLPSISRQDLDVLVPMIFPNGLPHQKIQRWKQAPSMHPEQILVQLRSDLPMDDPFALPSAARNFVEYTSLEHLSTLDRGVLSALALAGGSLTIDQLQRLNRSQAEALASAVKRLSLKGYLQKDQRKVLLRIPSTAILQRLRKSQIKAIARSLVSQWPAYHDPESLYEAARLAGDRETAASTALRIAKKVFRQKGQDDSAEWFWKAFSSGATLPRTTLLRMTKYFLRRSEMTRVSRLLQFIERQFGLSFRLADLYLDFFDRCNEPEKAAALAEQMTQKAREQKAARPRAYFSIRHAGFLILHSQLQAGERILVKEGKSSLEGEIKGLIHHYRGISYFNRGHLKKAIEEFNAAVSTRHRFQPNSLMNLGIAFGKLGVWEKAEHYLQEAIRIFCRNQDGNSLCYAYNNLGILLKLRGQIKEAREYYYRTMYLAKASRNRGMVASAIMNLASTYSLEGRLDRSIRFEREAARLSNKPFLQNFRATVLTNLGLDYAMQGKFQLGIQYLTQAATIREKLGLENNLADTFENLGLTYLFSKKYRKAQAYLRRAMKLFSNSAMEMDRYRAELYLALALFSQRRLEEARKILKRKIQLPEGSFEEGLHQYLFAMYFTSRNKKGENACREALHKAELIFRKFPSLFWLAKLHKLKAEYYLGTDHYEKAILSLQSAYNIFSRLGARKELFDLAKGRGTMKIQESLLERMAEKLPYKVLVMIKEVLSEKDPDAMVNKILAVALEFTDMERAVLILQEDPPRIFKSVTLDEPVINEICEISRSAAEFANQTGKPLICLNATSDPLLQSKPSILANQIISIVCLPLKAEGRLIGFLYLDSREGVEILASTETILLEIFASIIAMALNTSLVLEHSLKQNEDLRASLGLKREFPQLIGNSKPMLEVLQTVHHVLDSDLPVLLTGETGTGKELIARVLHYCGKRKNGPFVAVNCSALSETLLESELFGHEKGAFTGATLLRKGLFEEATNGTLFLDEIGDMLPSMQVKFLRVLQDGEFRRLGGSQTLHTNARIVLATNRNIADLVKSKSFREDLYYRIKGAQVHLPPLRERKEDIPLLASFFLKSMLAATRKKIRGFSPEALDFMRRYWWPGNVRQLKTEVERIVAFTDHEWVVLSDFDPQIRETVESESPKGEQKAGTLREMERVLILGRLEMYQWNIFQTARSLGVTRNTLYSKMRLYNIPRKKLDSAE